VKKFFREVAAIKRLVDGGASEDAGAE
jgi:hypothetical protein